MKLIPILFVIASSFPAMVYAASCDKLREDIKTASDLLNKAQQATNFTDARQVMNNAKYVINEVAEDSRTCPCVEAGDLFDNAATKIRRASDADTVGKFNDYGEQGVKTFGAAIDALNSCPASQEKEPVSPTP